MQWMHINEFVYWKHEKLSVFLAVFNVKIAKTKNKFIKKTKETREIVVQIKFYFATYFQLTIN